MYKQCKYFCEGVCGVVTPERCPTDCELGPVCQCQFPYVRRLSDCKCVIREKCQTEGNPHNKPWNVPGPINPWMRNEPRRVAE